MSPDEFFPQARAPSAAASQHVTLSQWVNERFPAWEQLLSAHDVARLTRRPRWVVLSMMMLGRFPRKRRYHGRGIGWLRSDVLHWLGKDLRTTPGHTGPAPTLRPRIARQTSLPPECTELFTTAIAEIDDRGYGCRHIERSVTVIAIGETGLRPRCESASKLDASRYRNPLFWRTWCPNSLVNIQRRLTRRVYSEPRRAFSQIISPTLPIE